MELDTNSSFSSTCLPKVSLNPISSNLLLAIFLDCSGIIAIDLTGAITLITSPGFNFCGYIFCIINLPLLHLELFFLELQELELFCLNNQYQKPCLQTFP